MWAPDLPEHFVSIFKKRNDAKRCVNSFAEMIKWSVARVIFPKPEKLAGTDVIALHHELKKSEAEVEKM